MLHAVSVEYLKKLFYRCEAVLLPVGQSTSHVATLLNIRLFRRNLKRLRLVVAPITGWPAVEENVSTLWLCSPKSPRKKIKPIIALISIESVILGNGYLRCPTLSAWFSKVTVNFYVASQNNHFYHIWIDKF